MVLPDRETLEGKPYRVETEDWVVAVLTFGKGLQVRLSANFYVGDPADRRAGLEIHGDAGSLRTEWFAATAPIEVGAFGEDYHSVPPVRRPLGQGEWYCDWSAGVYGLWQGLRTGTPHPTDGAHAAHLVEIISAVHTSMREGRVVNLTSSFTAPQPLDWAR